MESQKKIALVGTLNQGLKVLLLGALLTSCASVERESKTEIKTLEDKIAALEQRLATLESKDSAKTEAHATPAATSHAPVAASPKTKSVAPTMIQARGKKVQNTSLVSDAEAGFTGDEAVQNYRDALILFNSKKYGDAILEFSNFIKSYGDHALAGSAQYYLGECYYKQSEYKLAKQEFDRVLVSYPRSAHIADTLKRLAETEDQIGMNEQADEHRQQLYSLFPQSPAANLASLDSKPAKLEPSKIEKAETTEPALDEPEVTAPAFGGEEYSVGANEELKQIPTEPKMDAPPELTDSEKKVSVKSKISRIMSKIEK